MSGASSSNGLEDLASEKAWPSLPPMGETKPIAHCPTAWLKPPASVVAAKANPAPPKTAVMTKAKAAPKIGSRRNSKGSGKKWSPKCRTTAAAAADLDPLPEPQQPAQAVPVPKEESDAGEVTSQKSDEKKEDKHEKKEDKHEKKEDKHEEKTESNHQETHYGCGNASASGSQDEEPIPREESSSEHGQSCNEGKKDDVSVTGDTVCSTVAGLEAEETEEFPKAETKDASMWPPLGNSAPKAQHMAGWAWGCVPASVLAAPRNPELTPWQKEQQRKQKIAQEEAAKKRPQQKRIEQHKKEAAERHQKKKEQEEKVKREKAEARRIQKEKEEFERQEKARKQEEAKELERQELERQEFERKKLERQELEKRDSEVEARQAAMEAPQPAEQVPEQEAQANTWQAASSWKATPHLPGSSKGPSQPAVEGKNSKAKDSKAPQVLTQECQKSDATEYGDEEHSDDENDQKMWKIFRERRAELLREA